MYSRNSRSLLFGDTCDGGQRAHCDDEFRIDNDPCDLKKREFFGVLSYMYENAIIIFFLHITLSPVKCKRTKLK